MEYHWRPTTRHAMLTLLTNADVFAPEPLGLRHVLVAGDQIVFMDERCPVLDDALNVDLMDLDGARPIPGFIDAHAHLTGGGGEAGYETSVPAPLLSEFTRAGVTTVIGLLGTDDLVRTTSSLISRIKALRAEGMSAFGYTGGYHIPPMTLTGTVRSDIVHIEELIGVGELAISDHRSSQPTLQDVLRLASEAHVAGLMTGKAGVVHFHVGDGSRGLELIREALDVSELPPRVYYPTHVNRRKALFEEACDLARSGCSIDITAFPKAEEEDTYSADEALSRYLDTDCPVEGVTISSDGGGCLPVFDKQGNPVSLDYARASALSETLRSLIKQGSDLGAVLPAFTSNVSRILRLSHKGSIAPGMDADLVVLGEDHLPEHVMARGRWHVKNKHPIVRGTFE